MSHNQDQKKKSLKKGDVRIIIEAFEHKIVDEAVKKLYMTAKDAGAQVIGPVPLPTKREQLTINRSTFVHKDAREQFKICRHRRLIDLKDVTNDTLALLQGIHLPVGVGVNIKVGS